MQHIRLPSFAKINLCLRILGKQPDGYHELRTVFQTVSLHDTLELELTRQRKIELLIRGADLPVGPENLVYRALDALRRELKLRTGIRATLHKRIPVGRGLGGGSSNAAVALIGLLRLTKRSLPPSRLLSLASSLGADVPFFLAGGRALGIGRGDEIYALPDIPAQTLLIVSPANISVLTRDAYSWVSPSLTIGDRARKISSFCALCWSAQGPAVCNDFEPAVFRRHPRLARIKRMLLQTGAAEAALAGSGSAVFGIYPLPAQARRAALTFTHDAAFLAQTVTRRRYLRALGWRGLS